MARERAIQIRVSQEEYDRIAELAGEMGISEYMRTAALGEVPAPRKRQKLSPPHLNVELDEQGSVVVDRDKQLTRLVKQLEAQGVSDAEEVARKRLGM